MPHRLTPPILARRWLAHGLLASWLLALWLGAWHHGQHTGAAPEARAHTASVQAGDWLDHDAGSQLCRLWDHLLLADALPSQPPPPVANPAGVAPAPAPVPVGLHAATLRLYQARAPPAGLTTS